jgi:hypothetical protein
MRMFLKVFGGISLLVVVVIVGMMLLPQATIGYSPSNNVLNYAEISKNPYKFKGMSGIMNPVLIRFDHMAGDQTAIYESRFIYASDQLAVTMDDNDPPRTDRWWRVYVEGPDDFTNGLGASIEVGEVKFEGYADPPPEAIPPPLPVQPQAQSESAPEPVQEPTIQINQTSPDGTQPPAPIVRQPPPQD